MTNNKLPLTEEELSELEEEFSERNLISKKRLTKEEIEKAKKEFLRKKLKEKADSKDSSDNKESLKKESKEKTEISFIDVNKFIEAQERILQKKDLNERKVFAENIEQRVSYPGFGFTNTSQDKRAEDKKEIDYSSKNYDSSKEKTYDPENDVEHNLVRTPKIPKQRDLTQLGRENPLTQDFNREINFKPDYSNERGSKLEQDYISPTKTDIDKIGREESSFFEREFGKKDKKYDLR